MLVRLYCRIVREQCAHRHTRAKCGANRRCARVSAQRERAPPPCVYWGVTSPWVYLEVECIGEGSMGLFGSREYLEAMHLEAVHGCIWE